MQQETKAITFVNPEAPATLQIEKETDGDLARIGELEIPIWETPQNLFMVQPGHVKGDRKEVFKGKAGQFYLTGPGQTEGMEEFLEEVYAIPIVEVGRSRKFKVDADKGQGGEVVCRSRAGGEYPAESIVSPYSDKCGEYKLSRKGKPYFVAECPQAKWENNEKPACAEIVTVAFLELTMQIPFTMSFYGTAISAWNGIQEKYKSKKDVLRQKNRLKKAGEKESISDYVLKFSSEDEGTFHRMQIDLVHGEDMDPNQFIPLLMEYYHRFFDPEKWVEKEEDTTPVQEEVSTPDMGSAEETSNFNMQ